MTIRSPEEARPNTNSDISTQTPPSADTPPKYAASQAITGPPPDFPCPCNNVVIQRPMQSIKEKFAINPQLAVPAQLLPPVEVTDGLRPNLWLQTTHGNLNSEAYVFGDLAPDVKSPQHTLLVARNHYGSATLRVNCPPYSRAPLDITVSSKYGSSTLYLPRSFCGHLTTSTQYGNITFSAVLQARMTMISDIDNTKRCFIGDAGEILNPEAGDIACVTTTYGGVKIAYIDEYVVTEFKLLSSLSKLLSLGY